MQLVTFRQFQKRFTITDKTTREKTEASVALGFQKKYCSLSFRASITQMPKAVCGQVKQQNLMGSNILTIVELVSNLLLKSKRNDKWQSSSVYML